MRKLNITDCYVWYDKNRDEFFVTYQKDWSTCLHQAIRITPNPSDRKFIKAYTCTDIHTIEKDIAKFLDKKGIAYAKVC